MHLFMKKALKNPIVTGLLLLGIGGAIGWFLHSPGSPIFPGDQREANSKYHFISPLLSCGDFNQLDNSQQKNLELRLQEALDAQKNRGDVTEVGVYFRELDGGPWIGINYNAKFEPGSLLKVPLAMSVYKMSESDPSVLAKSILFDGGDAGAEQHFTAAQIEPGKTYSVEDLVSSTIANSDNNAAVLLSQIVGSENLDASYTQLGIDSPSNGQDYSTDVRTYASFFRILYNATYLNHENSEHLLSLLSQSVFKDGIVAGVPKGTVVAHKFGERAIGGAGRVQLHDCGIVYAGNSPYLLCIMMRGPDFDTLAKSIADISNLVYNYVQ